MKKRLKINLTLKMKITESDMTNTAVDRPTEEIDNKFMVLLAIVEESYEGPSTGKQ